MDIQSLVTIQHSDPIVCFCFAFSIFVILLFPFYSPDAVELFTSGDVKGVSTGIAIQTASTITMEVNLLNQTPNQRTLHWFVNNQQVPVVVTNLPTTVDFTVCIYIISSLVPYHSITLIRFSSIARMMQSNSHHWK